DINLSLKWRIFDPSTEINIPGFALSFTAFLPTGDLKTGTGKVDSWGLKVLMISSAELEISLLSQNFLMGAVFVSRLLPFISFDIVSYAAGLSALSFFRFAVATFAGIVPASFLLAHFGSEMVADETDGILIAIILLGVLTALPFLVKLAIKSDRN
ncbi:MAG: TVP38/TMEM64 family protein, partial [Rhizobiales bacterium]|nr:TVP38/TMEM64 family protein [Hyphomicrobiales bacterium]